MYFNFRLFFRIAYLCIFKWKSTPLPLTPRRFLFLVSFFLGFPMVQLFNAGCLLLDEFLFSGYRSVKLEKPIFIVGNPRSGTTFIHRIMAKDEDRFFCFKTWEIVFPAISQKKTLSFLGRIDRTFGGHLIKAIRRIESRMFDDFSKMHRISLFVPEEDDKLLIHSFAHMDLMWFFPFLNEFEWIGQLDQLASPKDKKRMMSFYRNCIKRQAYYKGDKKQFLSKSPFASGRIRALQTYFPGCKIICMVRNPLEVVPSMIHMAREIWRSTVSFDPDQAFQVKIYEILKYYYTYPLEQLEQGSRNDYMLIRYNDLVSHPEKTIHGAFQRFRFRLSTEFLSILKQEEQIAKEYTSSHRYSIDDTHLTKEHIVSDLHDIYDRFGFDASF